VAIPGVELRVLDQQGHDAADDETGELCARGPNVMLGYWNDAAGTSQVLRDGWLRTGDLARRDQRGFFHVQARKNDLVKIQGFRVHPREVEDAVGRHFPALRIIVVPYQHHGTTRLALFGISHKLEPGTVDELRSVCLRELPRHKTPSFIEVLTHAPLNASMKLDRTALRRRAELGGTTETGLKGDPPDKMTA
jgi:acyl-CoA synthetase (AMP-forming)/AMP-acid ligase II